MSAARRRPLLSSLPTTMATVPTPGSGDAHPPSACKARVVYDVARSWAALIIPVTGQPDVY